MVRYFVLIFGRGAISGSIRLTDEFQHLLVVYTAYIFAAGSPGPSNMRIMGVAMEQGRKAGLAIAAGVLTGAIFWGFMAATGVSALLTRYAEVLNVLKMLGGIYLLYLAFNAGKAALTPDDKAGQQVSVVPTRSYWKLYRYGVLMHLTNPKAILAWVALMTLGLGPSASVRTIAAILIGCGLLGFLIFSTYAILFSTTYMVRAYRRARRIIESMLVACFALAGVRLLLSLR
jgi:threonine/homoserine/homoserine lactone efflux protein